MTEHDFKPKFMDLIENGWASDDNPIKYGYFLGRGYKSGRVNPGPYIKVVDYKNRIREYSSSGDTLSKFKVVGHYPDPIPVGVKGEQTK